MHAEDSTVNAPSASLVCPACGKIPGNMGYLMYHFSREHSHPAGLINILTVSSRMACPEAYCGKILTHASFREEHRPKHHNGTLSCPYPGCGHKQRLRGMRLFNIHVYRHMTEAHLQGRYLCKYPGCKKGMSDPTRLTRHVYQAHPGISKESGCPDCQQRFATDPELFQHYRASHSFSGPVTLDCPASGCSRIFRNSEELYAHYWNSDHPSFIENQGSKYQPCKCPFGFCGKVYATQVGLGIHSVLAHGSDGVGSITTAPPSEGAALGNTLVHAKPSTNAQLTLKREVDGPIERTPRDAAVEIDDESMICTDMETSDDVISDDSVGSLALAALTLSGEPPVRHLQESHEEMETLDDFDFSEAAASLTTSEMTRLLEPVIRYLQEDRMEMETSGDFGSDEPPASSSTSKLSLSTAVGQHQRAPKTNGGDAGDLCPHILPRILQITDELSADELTELWTLVISSHERQYVSEQLLKFDVNKPSETIIGQVRGSAVAAVVHAWIRLKALLNQMPLKLQNAVGRRPRYTARDSAWAILMHCMLLEQMRQQALPTALTLGVDKIPDRLRFPSQRFDLSEKNATFAQILNALAERAHCRKVHPESTQLRTIKILTEVPKYYAELKEVVLALYPGPHDSKEWFEVFGSG